MANTFLAPTPVEKPRQETTGAALQNAVFLPFMIAVQFVMLWLIPRVLGWLFVDKVHILLKPDDIDPHKGYVTAPNHQSMLDPFILSGQIPFASWRKLAPIRSFVYSFFFTKWYYYPFLVAFGCFPATRHDSMPYGLELAQSLLSKHQTINIFPEGRRTIPGTAYAKHGVAVLAKQPDVLIIPMHIQWTAGHLLGRRASITIGRPMDCSNKTAQEIMALIYGLKLPK